MNLTQPDLVDAVHQDYVRAGADIVETNTFGANRIKLASFGLADKLKRDQRRRRADRAARGRRPRLSSPDRSVRSASASSRGARPASTRRASTSASRRRRCSRAASISSSSRPFATSTRSARRSTPCGRVSDLPIVAQMTTEEDGNTLDGTPPEQFAPELEARGATIIGVNCAVGPAPMLETIERMEAVTPAASCRRSPTPASRATSKGATSISVRRSTWRRTRAASSCTTSASSAAAAARRPSTSGRSRRRSARSASGHARAVAVAPALPLPQAPARRDRRAADSARAEVAARAGTGARHVRARRRTAAAARVRGRAGHSARARAQALRRRRRQHPRRPACRRAAERAVAGGADRAAGRDRDGAALLVSRSQPARHPVGSARRARDGRCGTCC